MYPVSDAFLRAVRSNTRKYFWTGAIVTKGGMTYEFGAKEIVKGSGYISRQCCSRNDKNISGLLNQIEDNAKTGKIGINRRRIERVF